LRGPLRNGGGGGEGGGEKSDGSKGEGKGKGCGGARKVVCPEARAAWLSAGMHAGDIAIL